MRGLLSVEFNPRLGAPRRLYWVTMSSIAEEKLPDARGHFGPYGGRFVPETLMHPLQELEDEYFRSQQDPEFQRELEYYLKQFCGRPTPLYFAERLTKALGGAKIYLKREDLLHTGAHKINNCIGQILLSKRMGKTRIIAETGAGQHGVATATVAAMFGLKCVVYMGAVDCERQSLNVFRMKMLGAEVVHEVAHQEVGLVLPVVHVERLHRLLRLRLLVELGEDEVLVQAVDVDVEVVDGVGLEVDDELGEALAALLLRVGEPRLLGHELVGPDPPRRLGRHHVGRR